ncbi:MAG: hypothetical protein JNJ61_22040 [Anaerolineae bacterium]|nr:hypothetical protein [Anaerolineae bacterium]
MQPNNSQQGSISASYGVVLREWINKFGYSHPETIITRECNNILAGVGLRPIQSLDETIICHLGINKGLVKRITLRDVIIKDLQSKIDLFIGIQPNNAATKSVKTGEVLFTNFRAIFFGDNYTGSIFQKRYSPFVYMLHFKDIVRYEKVAFNDYTNLKCITHSNEVDINIQFPPIFDATVPMYPFPPATAAEAEERERTFQRIIDGTKMSTELQSATKDAFLQLLMVLITQRPPT